MGRQEGSERAAPSAQQRAPLCQAHQGEPYPCSHAAPLLSRGQNAFPSSLRAAQHLHFRSATCSKHPPGVLSHLPSTKEVLLCQAVPLKIPLEG